ncbi:MAG: hypothetical protein ACD_75C00590G0001 [uncultured bacterium]|nr:MAG: hypothetical protein ACD_75C00590G0001 [uncultured bacterium]
MVIFDNGGQIKGRQIADAGEVAPGVPFHEARFAGGVQNILLMVPDIGKFPVDLKIGRDVSRKINPVTIRPASARQK